MRKVKLRGPGRGTSESCSGSIRTNLCKKLAQKVQGMSREEALSREKVLAELQDEVRQEKGKAKNKPSLAFKASTKNKASLKTKPSAKLKSKKKHSEKTALVKASAKAASKQHLSEDPPLPQPEQAPPAENESEDPLPVQEAIVVSEAAGKLSFGKQAGPLMAAPQVCTPVSLTLVGGAQEL